MFNYTQLRPDECEYVEIGSVADIGQNDRIFIELDEVKIVLFNIAGTFFAIGDVCTHDDGPLGDGDLDEFEVACPRHGARFDVRSGKVTTLPAIVDIPAYPVRVVDGMIQVGLPKNDQG